MKITETGLPGVLILEPRVFEDARGFFMESWNRRAFREATGADADFVQDNHSRSAGNVLRGLHFQLRQPQGKLVRVTIGEIWDVAVDMRRSSAHFGKWTGFTLSADNRRMAWIPRGFAHGFLVAGSAAEVQYKATDYYAAEDEHTLLWSDPALGIRWPLTGTPLLSEKDRRGRLLAECETFT